MLDLTLKIVSGRQILSSKCEDEFDLLYYRHCNPQNAIHEPLENGKVVELCVMQQFISQMLSWVQETGDKFLIA